MKKELLIDYAPRVWQQFIHDDPTRFRVVLAHRSGGKSFLAMGELVQAALRKKGVYAYVAPQKDQGRRNIWQKLKDMVRPIPGMKVNETESRMEFPNGSFFYILGADNPENIRGMHLSGVVMDEVADMPFDSWGTVLRPALQANRGWALFIGTPKKGNNLLNHARDLGLDEDVPNWNTWIVDGQTSGVYTEEELEEMRQDMLPSQFAQEIMMEETASEGEIYANLLEEMGRRGQIGLFPYDERYPVHTGWDIGYNDYTVIWFAQVDPDTNRIYLIDYYKNRRQYMAHYVNHVLSKPYRYGTAFLPHDINQTRMDKEYSELAKFKQAGLKYRVLPKTTNVLQSVQAVQAQLNRCFFNKEPCSDGLDALSAYDTVKDKKSGKYTDKLRHCDVSDAFRYLMEGVSGVRSYEMNQRSFKKAELALAQKPSSMSIARKRLNRRRK
jgi:hypothetical protein